jgi:hypothetical protein
MSKLDIRIQNAIESQLRVIKKMNKLREEMQANEIAYSNTVGKLTVLAELYQESTGRDLQKDLETDASWKERVDAIQKRLNEEAGSAPAPQPTATQATMKAVPATPAPQPEEKPQQPVARTRQPATITVDDNPPGPGPDED